MASETAPDPAPGELDLGRLADAPVLLFGGPYSNLPALEAVLAVAADRAIPPERVICTGDIVAYCADAAECARLVRDSGIVALMGNCEESLAFDAADCGCGFDAGTQCDLLSRQWYAHAEREVGAELREWMAGLPRQIRFTLAGRRFVVTHGAPDGINRFVFASAPGAEEKARLLRQVAADAIIAGHSGLPFAERLAADGLWLNAGAIGMPANDGTPRGWFAMLDPGPAGLAVSLEPLHYDHDEAVARMRRAGLESGYRDALTSGLWPSQDVLPPAERERRGKALEPVGLLWADGARDRDAA